MKKVDNVDAVYIHIPFCNYICAYCDFCKILYNKKFINSYFNRLEEEIKTIYRGEVINSLYIGGGTPSSLSLDEIKQLFNILTILNLSQDCEITFEANPDSLTLDKIKLLKSFGVNRISLGVETINKSIQSIIERYTSKDLVRLCITNLKNEGIANINVDLIYAFKDETLGDLKNDLNFLISLDVPHISTYSLIIEENTKLKLKGFKNIDKKLDRKMYDYIIDTLQKNNYIHYEISNFSKEGYHSKHNLKYWYNLFYYGFGVGASSYLNNTRYTNTRSITNYINGKSIIEKEVLTIKDQIFYEVMLNFRTKNGINKKKFKDKYGIYIDRLFSYENLVKGNVLIDDKTYLRLNPNYFYVLDEVVIKFLDTLQTNVYDDIIE